MKYEIITAKSPKDLIEKVNKKIEEGWKPQGGAACDNKHRVNHMGRAYVIYFQAMMNNRGITQILMRRLIRK